MAEKGNHAASTPPTFRRIGAADSKTRSQLLDAAEKLLVEEGYAAVTSRRLAARAGLKPQLVHYYFRTMDALYVEVFRRHAEKGIGRFEQALREDPSLSKLWKLTSNSRETRFSIEFAALANHRKAIRAELASYADRFRAAQLEVVSEALAARGISEEQLPPIVALLALTGLAQVMGLEHELGFTAGHEAANAYVETLIAQPESPMT